MSLFLHQVAADHQRVHSGTEECAHGIGRRIHDGFAAQVERRVHDHGHAGALAEFIDQVPVQRIDFFFDRLRTRAAIHVRDRGNDARVSPASPDW